MLLIHINDCYLNICNQGSLLLYIKRESSLRMMKLQVIPEKIAKSLSNKFEGYVSLTCLSVSNWKVKMTAIDDTLFLKSGWIEFVEDHSLEENYFLVFK